MRRTFFTAICFLAALTAGAQGLSERVFLSTDRAVYVAGEDIRVSAFCMDASDRRLSDFSSVCYIELRSSDGLAACARAALAEGRGAAVLTIPTGVPTGNYRLFAFTAQNRNEDGFDLASTARTVSVINPYSSARVAGGVNIVPDGAYGVNPAQAVSSGGLSISAPEEAVCSSVIPVSLTCGKLPATVSISVWNDDGIAIPESQGIDGFVSSLKPGTSFSDVVQGEYEGEIIRGRVVGATPGQLRSISGGSAFISAPGDQPDVYSATIGPDGSLEFYTSNIYGNREIVCEIEGLDKDSNAHIDLESPFVDVDVDDVPVLNLSESLAERIKSRALAAQIERTFTADTLFQSIPHRGNIIFGEDESVRYVLDDYTRFPTMEEVIVEFVTELRSRRNDDGTRGIQARVKNLYEAWTFLSGQSLIMIDGVPVFDHSRVLDYDPLLVEYIDVYPYQYFFGVRSFSGVANFVTYRRNMPSVEFGNNVRIVDFTGASYPSSYTCAGVSGDYPDLRRTAYWHPLVELDADAGITVDVKLPQYPGRFVIEVTGLASDGSPVYSTAVVNSR